MSYIGNPVITADFPTDTLSGNGSTTAFTLSRAPASVNAVVVVVSGVVQDPSTYTVSGTTLTFSAAPPTGTNNVSIRHLGVPGIPNTPSAASVGTTSIIDASVTQAKLGSNVAGNGPAFHAYQSTQQTGISAGVFTKVNLQTEEFDTNNCFDTSTSTFTPNVAGYYQVNATVWTTSPTSATILAGFVNLWKNGAWYKDGSLALYASGLNETASTVSTLVYMNGTTDYLQMYIWGNTTTSTYNLYGVYQQNRIHFSASLVRAA